MRQIMATKTQNHSKVLLCALAEGMSSRMREKEIQVMSMKRRNMELEGEGKIRGLMVESHAFFILIRVS